MIAEQPLRGSVDFELEPHGLPDFKGIRHVVLEKRKSRLEIESAYRLSEADKRKDEGKQKKFYGFFHGFLRGAFKRHRNG